MRSANATAAADSGYVNLASSDRTAHILTGDGPGRGGHLWPGQPGKSPFPQSWSGPKIMHEISDIATDPSIVPIIGQNRNLILRGTRDGIDIEVIIARPGGWNTTPAGEIVTGYPTNLPRNPK